MKLVKHAKKARNVTISMSEEEFREMYESHRLWIGENIRYNSKGHREYSAIILNGTTHISFETIAEIQKSMELKAEFNDGFVEIWNEVCGNFKRGK